MFRNSGEELCLTLRKGLLPKAPYILKEKTFEELGFKNEGDEWKNLKQYGKDNLMELLHRMINDGILPDIQICIGEKVFNCHLAVLQCYSNFFANISNFALCTLPENVVSPYAFEMIYKWMLIERSTVPRYGILDIFKAASFLEIPKLVAQCWCCFDDDNSFIEDKAFMLYLEAKQHKFDTLGDLMLQRIGRFFLPLVASDEFINMNVRDVCMLLASNCIMVHSEIEVFFAAVRWLNANWEERKQELLTVMEQIRFNLMPKWFLVELRFATNFLEVARCLNKTEMYPMVKIGIDYTSCLQFYNPNHGPFHSYLATFHLTIPKPRQWISLKNAVSYGGPRTVEVTPAVEADAYMHFLEYMKTFQTKGNEEWRSFQLELTRRYIK